MNSENQIICPLCNDEVDKLVYRFHIDSERAIIEKIKIEHPGWTEYDGVCGRCLDYYHTEIVMGQHILPQIGPHFPIKSVDDFIILPTGLRLDANPKYTGKNVTICFVDSGFYEHPDLVASKNRIKLILDLTNENQTVEIHEESLWHGTMTSVVCAGDGYLSKGLYKGIASDSSLVLLKVQDKNGKITNTNIIKALEWILENHRKYDIRIVNLSLRADEATSFKGNHVDELAEQLISEGIIVVAAVGNEDNGLVYAPANSPNVIAVGGIDDNNRIDEEQMTLYHSTFGKTVDGFRKPELVAQAVWIAAPLLPNSPEQQEAVILHDAIKADDNSFLPLLDGNLSKTKLDRSIIYNNSLEEQRLSIKKRIQHAKYISSHYIHVDGTSFAAPIVTAVIAQLLEIQPELKPNQIRQLLFSSAKRLKGIDPVKQGFGAIQPRVTALKILKKSFISPGQTSPSIKAAQNTIEFLVHHDSATQISLAGDFNNWAEDVLLLEPSYNGIWKIEIPLLSPGKYQYKFFVDSSSWMEDVSNPYREPDGYNGFNSILIVEPYLN